MLLVTSRSYYLHGKNDYAKISTNLVGYKFENHFIKSSQ